MLYSKKIEYLKNYVNFGMNYKAKEFVMNEWILSQRNDEYDTTVSKCQDVIKYIDNLIIMYRKQFPKMSNDIQKEISILGTNKIKRIKAFQSQYSIF